jgi:transcriptional regulator with XRE-family HTH domain
MNAQITDDRILEEIGERIARVRLARNLTQEQLAEQAGLGLRTVQRLELGAAATQLSGFIRVCRVLGLIDRLENLIPEEPASPIALLKQQGHKRKRASGRKPAAPALKKWTWGEPS